MGKLLIATNNAGKLREFAEILVDQHIAITSPAAEGIHLHVAETGQTYAENATIKAVAHARASGLFALADDSGLEVDALDGRPGVRSARFGGDEATDRDRVELLLRLLQGVPLESRTARYRAVVALASPDGVMAQAEGTCEGLISFTPRGSRGFGYDPIFYLPRYRRTMAELPSSLKNRLSHRALATKKLRDTIHRLVCTF